MGKIINRSLGGQSKFSSFNQVIKLVFFGMVVMLLSGCSASFMSPKGEIASEQKTLFIITVLLMLIVVIPVFFLIVYFCWRYRASNKKATYKPEWSHSVTLEFIWWTIPCIIIAVLAIITWISTHHLDPYNEKSIDSDKKPIVIQAISLDWKWLFIYPEENIATINYIQFPEDQPVKFEITSDAPMNAFVIPSLAGQIYAMEGMQTVLYLIANEKGVYPGRSANFSGDGFSGMTFNAKVTSQQDYEQWINEVRQSSSKHLSRSKYNELAKPSEDNRVEYFSSVKEGLFEDVIMKFMQPDRHQVDEDMSQEIKL